MLDVRDSILMDQIETFTVLLSRLSFTFSLYVAIHMATRVTVQYRPPRFRWGMVGHGDGRAEPGGDRERADPPMPKVSELVSRRTCELARLRTLCMVSWVYSDTRSLDYETNLTTSVHF